ncbi:hypothetical protein N8D56_22885 [Devosia sp. A8/3-2]|nr:hypothetical protein N8D56_22885 [Devosia sp. A8/3-2]
MQQRHGDFGTHALTRAELAHRAIEISAHAQHVAEIGQFSA